MQHTHQSLPDIVIQNGKATDQETNTSYSGNTTRYIDPAMQIDKEYKDIPVTECKPARLSIFRTLFSLSFGLGFLAPVIFIANVEDIGHLSLTVNGQYVEDAGPMDYLFLLPFFLVGVISLLVGIVPFIRLILVSLIGETLKGTVIGYERDNLVINGQPALCPMIKVHSNDGEKIIRYKSGEVAFKYQKGDMITLKKCGHMVTLKKCQRPTT